MSDEFKWIIKPEYDIHGVKSDVENGIVIVKESGMQKRLDIWFETQSSDKKTHFITDDVISKPMKYPFPTTDISTGL